MESFDTQHSQDIAVERRKLPRSLLLSGFVIGAIWLVSCFRMAAALSQFAVNRINRPAIEPLLEQALLFVLAVGGLRLLDWLLFRKYSKSVRHFFLQRPTTSQEAQRGIALGWGAALVAVLPLVLMGGMHPQFSFNASSLPALLLAICTLIVAAATATLAFQGYLFRWLSEAFGATPATIFVSLLYAILAAGQVASSILIFATAFLFSLLLCSAYRRTHALWVAWGVRFAWSATFGILMGLPFSGASIFNGVVTTESRGARWLTGGDYGPDGTLCALVVLLAALAVLHRITRDYAWQYTHEPIVGRAYAVVVQPPKAHTDMEKAAAAAPAPLVQILASTSTRASTTPEIEEHLRSESKS